MSRPAEFTVEVEGVGTFTFADRTMRREFAIAAEYSRLTGGVDVPAASLVAMAQWVAALKVLTLKAPDGWDIDAMDPLDPATWTRIEAAYGALSAREAEFRIGPKAPGAGAGAGNG